MTGVAASTDKKKRLEYQDRALDDGGSLEDFPLAELLHAGQREGVSCVLRLRHGAIERVVYILNGHPAFIESDLAKENLGYYLLANERITREEQRLIHETMRQTGQRQADLLLDQGFLNPHELYEVLADYVTEKVVSCFAWKQGTYVVEKGDSWSDRILRFRIDASRLLLNGLYAHGGLSDSPLLEDLAPEATLYVRPEGAPLRDQLALTTQESRLIQQARGRASLQRVVRSNTDGDRVGALLYGFFVLGIVGFDLSTPVSTEGAAPSPSVPRRPAAPRIVHRIDEEYERVMKADYFTVLKLKPGVDTAGVHQAFRTLSPPFRPENVQDLSMEIREKAGQVFVKMLEAYRVLADREGRREYGRRLRRPRGSLAGERAGTFAVATSSEDSRFRRAQRALEADRLSEGLVELADLVRDRPDELRYQAWYIWAQFLSDPGGFRREAESSLARLSRQDPDLPETYALMARIFENEIALDQARRLYRLGLKRLNGHVALTRESRLFEARVKKGMPRKWATQEDDEASSALDQDVGALMGRVVDSIKRKLGR